MAIPAQAQRPQLADYAGDTQALSQIAEFSAYGT
jgi:hypothetical protein